MKKALEILKEMNIGLSTLSYYARKIGIDIVSPNQKIDSIHEDAIKSLHYGLSIKPVVSVKVVKNEIISKQELPPEFSTLNPFKINTVELIEDKNRFNNRPIKIIEYQGVSVNSIFTDFEAFTICNGVNDKHVRFITQKYFQNPNDLTNIIEAHEIAMMVKEKYGAELLSYIISLPPLPFKVLDATQIFAELDKRKNTQEFPILRIALKKPDGTNEKIQISFYAENKENTRIRNENVLIVKNQTTTKKLFRISRDGVVLPESNSYQIVPVIELFVRFSMDTKSMILNYGLETGECSICGRELTDPLSIRRGIGPVCYQYVN